MVQRRGHAGYFPESGDEVGVGLEAYAFGYAVYAVVAELSVSIMRFMATFILYSLR